MTLSTTARSEAQDAIRCYPGREISCVSGTAFADDPREAPGGIALTEKEVEPADHDATGGMNRGAFLQVLAMTGTAAVAWGAVARSGAGAVESGNVGLAGASQAKVFGEVIARACLVYRPLGVHRIMRLK